MEVWHRLIRFISDLQVELEEHLMDVAELRGPDWDVLSQLGRTDQPLVMSELARRVHFRPSRLSNRVRGLEARGLVERVANEDDGRSLLVGLTSEGRRLLKRVRPIHRRWVEARLLGRLDERQLLQLGEILERLQEPDQS